MIPSFTARTEPLPPRAVVARGACATRLADRITRMPEVDQRHLRVVALPGLLIALADEALLPWVDGVEYLGVEPGTGMWVPTTQTTSIAAELVERAMRRTGQIPDGPFALLGLTTVVPLGRAAPATPHALDRVRERSEP